MPRQTPRFLAVLGAAALALSYGARQSQGYPSSPAHGGRGCLDCHQAAGPWRDKDVVVLDVLDAGTERSYRTAEGEFAIPFSPGEEKALLALVGVRAGTAREPRLAGWAFLDDEMVRSAGLASAKFPAGWSINRPYDFSYLDDRHDVYPGALLARVPFAIRAEADARNEAVSLHVLIQGERDMSGPETSYHKATVKLLVQPERSGPVVGGAQPPSPPARAQDKLAEEVAPIWRGKRCAACHRVDGVGGTTGPDLTHIGSKRSRQELEKYLRDPKSVYPSSYILPTDLPEEQLAVLLDYLSSLK